jgi:energy-coupling factor transporter ATP-binding protein EcfA2
MCPVQREASGEEDVLETRRTKNLLLTGRPGVGKTTVVQAVVRLFPGEVGGFLTGEIRERGTYPLFGHLLILNSRCAPSICRIAKQPLRTI